MTLIERLEAAETGNRELDWEIFKLLHPDKAEKIRPNTRYLYPEAWTTSIDAALPDKRIVEVKLKLSGKWRAVHAQGGLIYAGTASTEALARRIASLRAREGMKEKDE